MCVLVCVCVCECVCVLMCVCVRLRVRECLCVFGVFVRSSVQHCPWLPLRLSSLMPLSAAESHWLAVLCRFLVRHFGLQARWSTRLRDEVAFQWAWLELEEEDFSSDDER